MSELEKLVAAGTKVIVKIKATKDTSEGGIVLTEDTVRREQDTISEGKLVSLGAVAFYDMGGIDVNPKVGDKVFFVKFAGLEVKRGKKYYRIMNDEDIYAGEAQKS